MDTKSLIINSSNIGAKDHFDYFHEIFLFLKDLETEYPNFKKWYFKKVLNSVIRGERNIILKYHSSEILGVSIIKKNLFESKICTLRVNEKYKGLGIGTELLSHSIELLKEDKPLITVSSKRLTEFNKLLLNFDFQIYNSYNSYYLPGLDEYSYNLPLYQKEAELIKL